MLSGNFDVRLDAKLMKRRKDGTIVYSENKVLNWILTAWHRIKERAWLK